MMRSVGVKYMDIPELSNIENTLRQCNETYRDRQVRVKLEAYSSFPRTRPHNLSIDDQSVVTIPSPKAQQKKLDLKRIFSWENEIEDVEVPVKKLRLDRRNELSAVATSSLKLSKVLHPKKNLFKNLVLTLNLAFNDYDFSSVKIEQFQRRSPADAMNIVRKHFLELSSGQENVGKVFEKDIWEEMERVLAPTTIDAETGEVLDSDMYNIHDVQIYTYSPESETEIDADPLSSLGNLWSFNFFFCNPAVGRVVFLACSCRPRKFSQSGESLTDLAMQDSFLESFMFSNEEEEEPVEIIGGEQSVGLAC